MRCHCATSPKTLLILLEKRRAGNNPLTTGPTPIQQHGNRNTKRPGLSLRPGRPSHKIAGLWQATAFRQSGVRVIADRMQDGQHRFQSQAHRAMLRDRGGAHTVLNCDRVPARMHSASCLLSENRAFGFSARLTSLDRIAGKQVAGRNNIFCGTTTPVMQQQHLQPNEVSANDLNPDCVSGNSDLASSTEIAPASHPLASQRGARQSPTEESNLLAEQDGEVSEHESLLEQLIAQARKRNLWRRVGTEFLYVGVLLTFIRSVSDWSAWLGHGELFSSDISVVLGLTGFIAVVGEGITRWRWGKSVARLTNIDDVRAVGALAEAIDIPDKRIRSHARAALMRLLPYLQSEDACLLNEAQRNCLYRCLKIENARTLSDFMVVLLETLEKIGDAGSLSVIQELAVSTTTIPEGKRVQEAARKCLPALRLRVRTLETSSTLLRAFSAENVADTSLLRPAHGGDDTAPEQLLRASDSPPES